MKIKSMNRISSILLISIFALSAVAQDIESMPKYGEDSVSCIRNTSLYAEFVKQKNYEDALPGWRWVFNNCPKSSKNIYLNGVKIYKYFMKKDKSNLDKYVDTLMMIYDQRITYFGQKGIVLGRKGYDLQNYRKNALEEYYGYMLESYNILGKNMESVITYSLMKATVSMFKSDKIEKEQVVDVYANMMEVVEEDLDLISDTTSAKGKKQYERMMKIKTNIEALFSNSGAADASALVNLFTKKFNESPEDTKLLKKIIKLLDKTEGGQDTELFANATEKLFKLEPSSFAAYNLGKLFLKKEDYNKATDYYKQAIELEEDSIKIGDYYYELGVITFSKLNDNAATRNYALKAIRHKKNWGKPYILIGNAYAASSKSCGTNDFEKKAVYWAAVDKFITAKSVDSSVADEANKQIASYSQHFPNNEDAFFYGFTEGKTYEVGCWINEKTKVRF